MEEIDKIALNSNDDKSTQSINSIETYAYGTGKDLVSEKKKEIKLNNIISGYNEEHNPNWIQIPDHPYRVLIMEDSGSGKTKSSFNLISQQTDLDKIYLYAKDPYEAKQ